MSDKSIAEKILEVIPEDMREDFIKEMKAMLIERGEVKDVPQKEKLTPGQLDQLYDKIIGR